MRTSRPAWPLHGMPGAWVLQAQSLEEYVAATGLVDVRPAGRTPAQFTGTVTGLDLGALKLRLTATSGPLSLVGAAPDAHLFVLPMAQRVPPRTICGRAFPTDSPALFHHRPNELVTSKAGADAPWPTAALWVTFDELARCGALLSGRDLSPSRADMAIMTMPASVWKRLRCRLAEARDLVMSRSEVVASSQASRALGGVILEALVGCLARGDMPPDRAATRRRHQIMARLEQVLRERSEDMLTLADICAAVGVAERTLHLVCQEFVGVGPMQYSRSFRLRLARQALLTTDPRVDQVSTVAMRYGFWALGRFAAAYQAMFGEVPSETLRRTRLSWPVSASGGTVVPRQPEAMPS